MFLTYDYIAYSGAGLESFGSYKGSADQDENILDSTVSTPVKIPTQSAKSTKLPPLQTSSKSFSAKKTSKKLKRLKSKIKDALLTNNKPNSFQHSSSNISDIMESAPPIEGSPAPRSPAVAAGFADSAVATSRETAINSISAIALSAFKPSTENAAVKNPFKLKNAVVQGPEQIRASKMGNVVGLAVNVGKAGAKLKNWSETYGEESVR